MRQVIIEIPQEVAAAAMRVPSEEQEMRLRRELALRLYQKGLLSFGKAREFTGMNKWGFHLLLGEEGILRHYDVDELEEDLKTLRGLS
jgi:predicted HTH domain antitoxin